MEILDTPSIRLLVQHSEPIVAMGLKAILHRDPNLNLLEAIHGVDPLSQTPDVIVCDHECALSITLAARDRGLQMSNSRVLALAVAPTAGRVRQALEAGVHGYLESDCPPDELLCAVRMLASGRRYLSAAAARHIAESLAQPPLTRREHEVLGYLASGKCNKTIARQLDISVTTVKAHVQAIMGKLGAGSRTEAVSIAAHRGLVTLGKHVHEGGHPSKMAAAAAHLVRQAAMTRTASRVQAQVVPIFAT